MAGDEVFSLRVEKHFAVPVERVFDAWLDPVSAAKWLFATPNGAMIRADIEASVGGEFCLVERREDEDIEHYGEFIEIDRPKRIVFDFSVNQGETTRVAIDIAPAAGGGSDLVLTHTMHARWAEYAARSKQGWEMILEGLAREVG